MGLLSQKQDKARVTVITGNRALVSHGDRHEVRQGLRDPIGRYEEVEAVAAKKVQTGLRSGRLLTVSRAIWFM